MSTPEPPDATHVNTISITVHGGKKDTVEASVRNYLVGEDDASMYQTWVNIAALRRIGLMFQGGVESAGAITDLLCLVTVLAAVIALFVFWQLVVFFIVIAVLTLLSGGAAFKYLRGTFITAEAQKIDANRLERFVSDRILAGNFVGVSDPDKLLEFGPITRRADNASLAFRAGIYISLGIATVFLIFEIIFWYFNGTWWPPQIYLWAFGLQFLFGVLIMDIGVYLRWNLSKSLLKGQ